jgi:murein DD-endopeptidase MepM/ murein hydrolase activator NlpD
MISRADMLRKEEEGRLKETRTRINQERDDARSSLSLLMNNYAGEDLAALPQNVKDQMAEIEKTAGLPEGFMAQGMKTLKEIKNLNPDLDLKYTLNNRGDMTVTGTDKRTGKVVSTEVIPGAGVTTKGGTTTTTGTSGGAGTSKIADYQRIFMGSSANDKGVDLAGPPGSPIKASVKGTVESTKTTAQSGGWGNQVRIKDAAGNIHQYSHLANIDVEPGEEVTEGFEIGTMGNTGTVMGASGETLTPEQIAAGRGTHVDYTVYKPDGTPYSVEEAAKFAGVSTGGTTTATTEDEWENL